MKTAGALSIAATGCWLPETRVRTTDAVRDGLLEAGDAAKVGTVELAVAEGIAPPVMAALAARDAIAHSGLRAGELAVCAHAWINHQGHDFWSPAHYVANEVGAKAAIPVGVQQMCNGGPTALQLAAQWLLTEPGLPGALVTTADSFGAPGFNRWSGDFGVMYGDAGTAVVLRRTEKPGTDLDLLAITSSAAPELETLHRGADEFSDAPREHSRTIDVRRTKRAFLRANGADLLTERTREHVRSVLLTALADAGIATDDERIALIALPRLGNAALTTAYIPALSGLTKARIADYGTHTGHLGAGDTAATLHQIRVGGELEPGQIAAIISGGGGFTWSCVLVQRPRDHARIARKAG